MNVVEFIKLSAQKTKALDNHPALKGKQKSALPDKVQAMIIKKKMQKTAMMMGGPKPGMPRPGMPGAMGVPSYGEGGVVKHRKNGKIIRVAESGDEAIVPLAKKKKAERMAKSILKKVQKKKSYNK